MASVLQLQKPEREGPRIPRRIFQPFSPSVYTIFLARYFDEDRFDKYPPVAGFELEAWWVDKALTLAPINAIFLQRFSNLLVPLELVTFNVEFNIDPVTLHGAFGPHHLAGRTKTTGAIIILCVKLLAWVFYAITSSRITLYTIHHTPSSHLVKLTMNNAQKLQFCGILILLSACSAEQFNRAGYDALHQRHCIEQTGTPDCDSDYPDYDEYQDQRPEIPE